MDKPTATDLIVDAIYKDNNNSIQRDRCNICNKRVLDNQKTVSYQCYQCNKWSHNKCDDTNNNLNGPKEHNVQLLSLI